MKLSKEAPQCEGQQAMYRLRYDGIRDVRDTNPSIPLKFNKTGGSDWFGVASYEKVYQIIDGGWADGLARVRKALGQLSLPAVQSVRRSKARAEFGDEVDMQRVWSGDLNRAWSTTKQKSDPRRRAPQTITITARIGGLAWVSPEQLFWQGAVAVALIDALKRAGRACKLVGFNHSEGTTVDGKKESLIEIELLSPGQQVDMEKLASVLCLAGYWRTEMFKAMHCMPEPPGYGMGSSTNGIPLILKKDAQKVVEIANVYDLESAKKFLEKVATTL